MSTDPLLMVLADGEFHSGEELGELLQVSRTAVWKQIKKLEPSGLCVESVKGKGYRISGGLDLLEESAVLRGLGEEASRLISDLDIHDVLDSTNRLAMEKAVSQGASAYVCLAEQQTDGRGRRGKRWMSPYAGSIYLSVVWEFAGGATALEGLSLAAGVAVVEALQEVGVTTAQLKWPNDVLSDGRKLAGILLEMTGDAAGVCQVVVGIGINVSIPPQAGAEIDQPWVDVSTLAPGKVSRNALVCHLLNRLLPMLASYESRGFASYMDKWHALDAFAGQQVVIHLGREAVIGTEVGVDKTGAILLDTVLGRRSFSGGEISLRRLDDS